MAKRGSAKPPPKILLNWSFRFWDIDPGSALPRGKNLAGKGFGNVWKTSGITNDSLLPLKKEPILTFTKMMACRTKRLFTGRKGKKILKYF